MSPSKKSTKQVNNTVAPQTGDSPEFLQIPIDSIVASSQVRSGINIENDFVASPSEEMYRGTPNKNQ
jgi:hypothetical protein